VRRKAWHKKRERKKIDWRGDKKSDLTHFLRLAQAKKLGTLTEKVDAKREKALT